MTKQLLRFATFAVLVGVGAAACGGDDCVDGAERVAEKRDRCGLTSNDVAPSGAECTEQAGNTAQKAAACYEAADCAALTGTDVPGAIEFGTCIND